jgi:hypothetical protein
MWTTRRPTPQTSAQRSHVQPHGAGGKSIYAPQPARAAGSGTAGRCRRRKTNSAARTQAHAITAKIEDHSDG